MSFILFVLFILIILFVLLILMCIRKRISCVYTRDLLCMHNTLVRALGQGPQGPGTQKRRAPGPGTGPAPFLGPWPWGPWPKACTRVLCMHKRSLVYTQEILLCIHNYAKLFFNLRDTSIMLI